MPDDDITKCDLEAVKEAHFRLHREIMQEQRDMYERVHRMRAEARQRERDEHDEFERRVEPMRRKFEALTKVLTDYENLKPLGPITIPAGSHPNT